MRMREGAMADKQVERIKYETEVLKFTALITVGIGGGAIGLLLGEPTPLRLGLAGLGFSATLALAVILWRLDRRIRALIAQLKETP